MPDITRYRLANGLEVLLAPDPRRDSVAVNVWYHVGANHEPAGRRGIAHLAEHLMFEGSAHVPAGAHVRHLRELGAGALNAHTGRHRTRYLTTVVPEGLETVLWLESDRMGFILQGLTRRAFERERAVVLRELRERVDIAAYGPAERRLWEVLFPMSHPYHTRIEGTAEDLRAVSLGDVRSFIERWYGPSNATLVIAGDFDPVRARELVDRYFASLPASSHPTAATIESARLEERVVVTNTEPEHRAPALVVGWHAPGAGSREAVTAALTAELLGAGGRGLLHEHLVEDRRIASRVAVSFSEQAAVSVLRIRAVARRGVDPASLLQAVDEVVAGIEAHIEETDVARARRRLTTRRAAALDGPHGLIESAERIHRSNMGLAPGACVPRDELGKEAVVDYAARWLAPETSAVILSDHASAERAASARAARAGSSP